MYRIVVGELGGKPLTASKCRISALSSADYCLRDRVEVDRGKIAWKGTAREICRVFEAERLDVSGLKQLDPGRVYGVLFHGNCRSECA